MMPGENERKVSSNNNNNNNKEKTASPTGEIANKIADATMATFLKIKTEQRDEAMEVDNNEKEDTEDKKSPGLPFMSIDQT